MLAIKGLNCRVLAKWLSSHQDVDSTGIHEGASYPELRQGQLHPQCKVILKLLRHLQLKHVRTRVMETRYIPFLDINVVVCSRGRTCSYNPNPTLALEHHIT